MYFHSQKQLKIVTNGIVTGGRPMTSYARCNDVLQHLAGYISCSYGPILILFFLQIVAESF